MYFLVDKFMLIIYGFANVISFGMNVFTYGNRINNLGVNLCFDENLFLSVGTQAKKVQRYASAALC